MTLILKDQKFRDSRGELIWFPKNERPYFDTALRRTFNSKKEKCEYMKEKGLAMDGSSDKRNRPIEAGDNRFKRVR